MKYVRLTLKEAVEILAAHGTEMDKHCLGHPFVIPSSTIDALRTRVMKGRQWEDLQRALREADK